MINIARLIPFFSGEAGGPVKHIIELTKCLSKYPIKTTVYTCSELDYYATRRTFSYQEINPNFIIKRYNSYIRFKEYRISFGLIPSLIKDSKNIDIFHSHGFRTFQEDIAALIAIKKQKKFIITPHGALCTNINYFHYFYKRIYDLIDTNLKNKLLNIDYIAVAKIEIDFLKRYGIDKKKIHYIPHGINVDHFKPSNPKDILDKYNIKQLKNKNHILLYVGRLAKRKGIDNLINVLYLLKKEIHDIYLLIVGEDYGYKNTIKQLVKKKGMTKNIIFLGFVPKKDLPKIYSLANIVVYPSKFEIFGHVILEANACEKPIIASNHWGPKELIINNETGLLTKYGDIEELKEAIAKILIDEELQLKMGKKGRKHVKKYYSWERNAKIHYELYQKILDI